jgi:hypothetical protein
MQRLLNNLLAVAVIGLISTSGSLVMARGGGGHGGGHSSGGHSARSSGSRGASHHNNSGHTLQSHKSHPTSANKSHPKGTHKPTKTASNKGKGRHHRHRRHYHMHYPVGGWFDGDIEEGDADAATGGIDVQFASIRQLDAGDAAKNLAPAYRVWFTNNSDVDIDQAFDVAILAANDEELAQDLPYASMRIDGMAAGESTSVDIRLPIEAMSMGSDDGQAAPYAFVHTIIDAQRELVETNKSNNLAVYGRDDIPTLEE